MARLPYVDLATASDEVRQTLEALPVRLNVFRMMAVAETSFRPLLSLGTSILGRLQLDARLRELAILRVARLSYATYEWVQHVPIGKAVGVSDEQIAALERDEPRAACFDARDRAVLAFTSEVVSLVRASDAALAAVRAHLSDREVVELVLAVGYYMLVARLLETTGVDLEPAAGTAIVDAIR